MFNEDVVRRIVGIERRLGLLESIDRGVAYAEASLTNPPTDAELDSAFGTPTSTGLYSDGFIGIIYDTNGLNPRYIVFIANGEWNYIAGTLAT